MKSLLNAGISHLEQIQRDILDSSVNTNIAELSKLFIDYYGEDRVDIKQNSNALTIFSERVNDTLYCLNRVVEDCGDNIGRLEFIIKFFTIAEVKNRIEGPDFHFGMYGNDARNNLMTMFFVYHRFIEHLFEDKEPVDTIENIRNYPFIKLNKVRSYSMTVNNSEYEKYYNILVRHKYFIKSLFKLVIRKVDLYVKFVKGEFPTYLEDESIDIPVGRNGWSDDCISKIYDVLFYSRYYLSTGSVSNIADNIINYIKGSNIRNANFDTTYLVHFPTVRISNGKTGMDLKDIYARFIVDSNRVLKDKQIIRSSLTLNEYKQYYQHSHCSAGRFEFGSLCFGSGPISLTISKIGNNQRFDVIPLFLYRIFLFEFDQYLQVESLTGGPYKYLDTVLNCERLTKKIHNLEELRTTSCETSMNNTKVKKIQDAIRNNLNIFEYYVQDNVIFLNESIISFFIKINYLAKNVLTSSFDIKYGINNANKTLYIPNSSSAYLTNSDINRIQSEIVLVFKDQNIYKKILNSNMDHDSVFYGLPLEYYVMSYSYLMQLINFTKINDTCLTNKLQQVL